MTPPLGTFVSEGAWRRSLGGGPPGDTAPVALTRADVAEVLGCAEDTLGPWLEDCARLAVRPSLPEGASLHARARAALVDRERRARGRVLAELARRAARRAGGVGPALLSALLPAPDEAHDPLDAELARPSIPVEDEPGAVDAADVPRDPGATRAADGLGVLVARVLAGLACALTDGGDFAARLARVEAQLAASAGADTDALAALERAASALDPSDPRTFRALEDVERIGLAHALLSGDFTGARVRLAGAGLELDDSLAVDAVRCATGAALGEPAGPGRRAPFAASASDRRRAARFLVALRANPWRTGAGPHDSNAAAEGGDR